MVVALENWIFCANDGNMYRENFEKTQFQNKSRECQVLDTLTFTKVGFLDKILSLQETYCLQCLQTATSRNKFT